MKFYKLQLPKIIMIYKIVISLIALLMIIEGAIVTFNPKFTQAITRKLLKNKNAFRTIGIIELIIGIVLFLLVVA